MNDIRINHYVNVPWLGSVGLVCVVKILSL